MKPLLAITLLAISLVACDSKKAADDSSTTAETTESATTESETSNDVAEAPSVEVKSFEYDDKEFPGDLPAGEQMGGFAFEDSAGKNYVAFSREEATTEAGNPATILHVKHVAQSGDEVKEVRSYREIVEECEFDIVMEAKYGKWSVSDLDTDGVGEASFAYTVDCTSDISPNKHKVFVTEGGDKFVLRGATSVQVDEKGTLQGGEFEADEMSEPFMKHAEMVWKETSIGVRF